MSSPSISRVFDIILRQTPKRLKRTIYRGFNEIPHVMYGSVFAVYGSVMGTYLWVKQNRLGPERVYKYKKYYCIKRVEDVNILEGDEDLYN